MNQTTVTRLQFITDSAGIFMYDEKAIAKFLAQQIKRMQRQNAKIAANPTKYKGFSICDPELFATHQLGLYMHTFRLTRAEILK